MTLNNNLKEQSLKIASASEVFAVSSYRQILTSYPIIEKIDRNHWDFILTIAGVFVAISQLNHENIPEEEKDEILDLVTNSVLQLYPDGIDACEDCRQFVDRTYDGLANQTEYKQNPQYLFSDSLGGWIVWNLFNHAASDDDERKLVRVLGALVVHPFVSWWK